MCFFVHFSVAQENDKDEISIPLTMFDRLRSDVKTWNDSAMVLLDSCNKLNSDIFLLKKTIDTLTTEINNSRNLSAIISEKESLIIALQNQHKADSSYVEEILLQLKQMQEIADRATAQYANGRLYFKYESERIKKCIEDYNKIKTPAVKELFNQMPDLLNNYGQYSVELKQLLESAQKDPDRKVKNKANEYKEKYLNQIYNSFYYSHYYVKKSRGIWSIPYLNNIIEIALSILQKHDPGHNDPVNFSSLIEML